MPTPQTATRGSVLFEAEFTESYNSPEEKILDYDCDPKPQGTITRYQPANAVSPEFMPGFFQADEQARVLEAAKEASEPALSQAALLAWLGGQFQFESLAIDFSFIPANWLAVVPCFTTSIRYMAIMNQYTITAKANTDLTLAGIVYPKGDVLASFRVVRPVSYTFLRRYTWNPKCCEEQPKTTPSTDSTRYYFPGWEKLDYELPGGWKLKLGMEYSPIYPKATYAWPSEENGQAPDGH